MYRALANGLWFLAFIVILTPSIISFCWDAATLANLINGPTQCLLLAVDLIVLLVSGRWSRVEDQLQAYQRDDDALDKLADKLSSLCDVLGGCFVEPERVAKQDARIAALERRSDSTRPTGYQGHQSVLGVGARGYQGIQGDTGVCSTPCGVANCEQCRKPVKGELFTAPMGTTAKVHTGGLFEHYVGDTDSTVLKPYPPCSKVFGADGRGAWCGVCDCAWFDTLGKQHVSRFQQVADNPCALCKSRGFIVCHCERDCDDESVDLGFEDQGEHDLPATKKFKDADLHDSPTAELPVRKAPPLPDPVPIDIFGPEAAKRDAALPKVNAYTGAKK